MGSWLDVVVVWNISPNRSSLPDGYTARRNHCRLSLAGVPAGNMVTSSPHIHTQHPEVVVGQCQRR